MVDHARTGRQKPAESRTPAAAWWARRLGVRIEVGRGSSEGFNMSRRSLLVLGVMLVVLLSAGAKVQYEFLEHWIDPEFEPRQFGKFLVIGITGDEEARRNFENKFVSQLRGRGIQAVTSYSLVTHLATLDEIDGTALATADRVVEMA